MGTVHGYFIAFAFSVHLTAFFGAATTAGGHIRVIEPLATVCKACFFLKGKIDHLETFIWKHTVYIVHTFIYIHSIYV